MRNLFVPNKIQIIPHMRPLLGCHKHPELNSLAKDLVATATYLKKKSADKHQVVITYTSLVIPPPTPTTSDTTLPPHIQPVQKHGVNRDHFFLHLSQIIG